MQSAIGLSIIDATRVKEPLAEVVVGHTIGCHLAFKASRWVNYAN